MLTHIVKFVIKGIVGFWTLEKWMGYSKRLFYLY